METDVLIIGAGITGLSTGYYLKKQGCENFLILEEDDKPGGKVSSLREDGFIVDEGPDSLVSTKPAAYELVKDLGLENEVIYPSHKGFYIYSGKRLRKAPAGMKGFVPSDVGSFLRSRFFSFAGKMRILMEPFIPAGKPNDHETLADFMRRRFGDEMLEKYAGPLLSGIYASAPEKLGLMATFPQFKKMEEKHGSVSKAMLANRPKTNQKEVPLFYSLRNGMGALPEKLHEKLANHITTKTRIKAIEGLEEDKPIEVTTESDEKYFCNKLVLTTPAHSSYNLLNQFNTELATTLKRIPYVSTAVMSLAFRKKDVNHPLDANGFLIPQNENTFISSCTWTSTKWEHRCPEDYVLIRCFFGRLGDEEILEYNDKKLYDCARTDMESILGIKNHAVKYWIRRWHKAIPQYFPDHLDKIEKIEQHLKEYPNLFLTGAGYRGLGIPDCIAQGKKTAEQLSKMPEQSPKKKAL